MVLESKDAKILGLLKSNARLSVRSIAKQLSVPPTTVHSRIKKMEKDGVIRGYTTVLDDGRLGIGAKAFVFISLYSRSKKSSLEFIMNEIAKFPEVQEICAISGDWDILVKLKGKTTDDIGRFVIKNLRKIKGVEKTVTSIVFNTQKEAITTLPE